MAEVQRKRHNSPDCTLKFNPEHYSNDPILAPISAFSRVISYKDDTQPVNIDSARLMLTKSPLRIGDYHTYFYILSKLERNDLIINVTAREIYRALSFTSRERAAESLTRLRRAGLIVQMEENTGKYIVNPLFAWKGNRLDYLDLSKFVDDTAAKR